MNRISAVQCLMSTMQAAALSPNGRSSGVLAEAVLRVLFVHFLWLSSFKAYISKPPKVYVIYLMYFNKFFFCFNKLSSFSCFQPTNAGMAADTVS